MRRQAMQNNDVLETQKIMPTYNRFPVTLKKGKGSYVWDEDDTKYLDYTAGIATCNLGHVPDAVKEKVDEQLQNLWHCSNLYHIPSQEKLANLLTEHSHFDQVFFCNSGAEANEAAIKLVRRYVQKVKKQEVYEIVTFKQGFHGRTLGTLSATGQTKIQDGFFPLVSGFRYLPYNDIDAINSLSGQKTSAVMLEVVQGEGGVIPADQAWIDQLVAKCKEQDILIIVDEIQTGMGRTGTLFAHEQYGFEPDVMTLAKGLGSGFAVGAMLAKEEVAQAFVPGTHGSTFGGNPLATTAGAATIETILEQHVLENCQTISAYLTEKLEQLRESYPDKIKQVRGKGLMIGIEVDGPAIDIVNKARDEQLLILVAGPNVVRILPPLTTTTEEADEFINKLGATLAKL